MSGKNPITKWSVLALLTIVVGGGLTLLAGQAWILVWAGSGLRFTVGNSHNVDLPAGPVIVYYESSAGVPSANVDFVIYDDPQNPIYRKTVTESNSFKTLIGGRSGRSLWELDVPEAGQFEFKSSNDNISAEGEDRSGDRIVFLKQPATLAEAEKIRKVILITGGSITILFVIIFYIMHGIALRSAAEDKRSGPDSWRQR